MSRALRQSLRHFPAAGVVMLAPWLLPQIAATASPADVLHAVETDALAPGLALSSGNAPEQMTTSRSATPGIQGSILGDFYLERQTKDSVAVYWTSKNETDIFGYFVIRRRHGPGHRFERVTELVPAKYPGQDRGDTYRILDQEIPGGTWEYRLEIVWLDGSSIQEGQLWIRIWWWKTFLPLTYRR